VLVWFACGLAVLALPAAAGARVVAFSANFGIGGFSQFNLGGQTSGSNASLSLDPRRGFAGGRSARAHYHGSGSNAYARGVEAVHWNNGDNVWYGEAVYLPPGFKSAMQGEVDLMRWDNYSLEQRSLDWGGIVIYGHDKRARLLRFDVYGDVTTLVGPFDIAEGRWTWIEVHERFSDRRGQALSEVFLDGRRIGSSSAPNKYRHPITRIRFGLVAISENAQVRPLTLWFARPSVATRPIPTP
jgi:hypothetical protein